MKSTVARSISATFALTLLSASLAAGQSAEKILETAQERYEKRMKGVDNYTIVQDVMGFQVSTYFEKQMVDGRPMFVVKERYGGGEQEDFSEMYHDFMKIADRAKVERKEKVGGFESHVLTIEDFSGLDFAADEEFKPKKGTFYLDTGDYMLRKMVIEGTLENEGRQAPVTMEALFLDYRDVDGVLHPFRTQMNMTGLAAGMSEKDMEEARKSLKELREQMAEMPEDQRAMMQKMMGSQIERLEEMVNSGNFEMTIEVKELRVNQGPPQN